MTKLQLENVSYRYKNSERDVLSRISCEFEGGLLTSVVGTSGSGKTTLLSILAGLDKPSTGRVYIDGDDYASLDLDRCRREKISMIFQSYHLFPLLKVLENVSYTMEQNGVRKKDATARAGKYLSLVGITKEKHKRYPANLSGGEQQRVAIARALASGARIILADEPTGNLDTANSDLVIQLLKTLAHDNGYCVIIVTHNMEIAEASDKVYRMSDGILVAEAI